MALIPGTAGRDDLLSGRNDDYLDGGAGDDTLTGNGGNDTLEGGKGRDLLEGGKDNDVLSGGNGADTFLYSLGDGNDTITDYEEEDIIQFTSGTPKISTKGKHVIFTVGTGSQKGTITVLNAIKDEKIITWIDADGVTHEYPYPPLINGKKVTLTDSYNKDVFDIVEYSEAHHNNYDNATIIDASEVEHDIHIIGNKKANTIAGSVNDDTIEGGKGNDVLSGGDGADIFVYNKGDGSDKILDYENEDTIKIVGDTVKSIMKSKDGADYVFTLASRRNITIVGGVGKIITYVDDDYPHYILPPKPPGYSDGKVTIGKGYTDDTFDVNEFEADYKYWVSKVFVINASKVMHDINIIGNKLANTIIGSDNDDTIEGGKGNDVLTGGDGADVFIYNKGDGNDKILDYENEDIIKIVGDTVKKFSKSGDNLIMTLAGKKKITLVGGADKVITYTDDNNPEPVKYSNIMQVSSDGKSVKLKAAYSADTFDVTTYADFGETARTIDASAVDQDLTIVGNKKNNVIIGSDGDNTIEGGKGSDTLTGGSGKNVFVFNKGDGKDVITNYKNGDVIKGATGTTITGKVQGNDVILSISGGGKVTLQGASKKSVKAIDDTGTHWVTGSSKKITYANNNVSLNSGYTGDSFVADDFTKNLPGKVFNIDASKVKHDMTIIGNKEKNSITGTSEYDYIDGGSGADTILGGDGDDTLFGGDGDDTLFGGKGNDKLFGGAGHDTLWGGAGHDTLWGGDGEDIFVYNPGAGDDVIADYAKGDVIMILSGDSYNREAFSGDDVIFKFSSGQIVVQGAADKHIKFVDSNGKTIDTYTP